MWIINGSNDGTQDKIWIMAYTQFQLKLTPLTRPLSGVSEPDLRALARQSIFL